MRPGRSGNRPRAGVRRERPADGGTAPGGAIARRPGAAAETGRPGNGGGIAYHPRRGWREREIAIAALGGGGPEGEPR